MTELWLMQLLQMIFLPAYVPVGYVVVTIVDVCCSCYSLLQFADASDTAGMQMLSQLL
jgi:hypothetical protein